MAVRTTPHSAAWSITEAKARLDEVLDQVDETGPATLERNQDAQATVAAVDDWETHPALKGTLADFFHRSGLGDAELSGTSGRDSEPERRGTLVEFLDNSPLKGLEIDFERHPDTTERDVDLW